MANALCRALWVPLLLVGLVGLAAPVQADGPPSDPYRAQVSVERADGGFRIDVNMLLPVSPAQAWSVLTDYDHMASFLQDLSVSETIETADNTLKVHQKGVVRYAFFSAQIESTRDVVLLPMVEVRTHGTGGNLKSSDSNLQLIPEGTQTRLRYHAQMEPDFWFPPLIGPRVVRQQTEQQFAAMLAEMLRRRQSPGQ